MRPTCTVWQASSNSRCPSRHPRRHLLPLPSRRAGNVRSAVQEEIQASSAPTAENPLLLLQLNGPARNAVQRIRANSVPTAASPLLRLIGPAANAVRRIKASSVPTADIPVRNGTVEKRAAGIDLLLPCSYFTLPFCFLYGKGGDYGKGGTYG